MTEHRSSGDSPLVSVILPVKNEAHHLAAAIDSVLSQDHVPLELIVVDDHSSDGTAEIARKVEGVRLVLAESHGIGGAWNAGLKLASGSLVAFQAADDRWTPTKLQAQTAYMLEHPDVDYCIGRTRYCLEPGTTPQPSFRKELLAGDVQLILMEAAIFKKTAFDRVGYFDESLSTAQEVEWCARANDAGLTLGRMDELVLVKRVHDRNLTYDPALACENNSNLMRILRASAQRKRRSQK